MQCFLYRPSAVIFKLRSAEPGDYTGDFHVFNEYVSVIPKLVNIILTTLFAFLIST
jgi:hypothetical protein